VAYLVLAFAQLAREGLGPERSRVDLTGVAQLDTNGREAEFAYPKVPAPLALDLAPDAPTTRVRVVCGEGEEFSLEQTTFGEKNALGPSSPHSGSSVRVQ